MIRTSREVNLRRRLLAMAPLGAAVPAWAQAPDAPAYASWQDGELLLKNGQVLRRIRLPGAGFHGLQTLDYRTAQRPSRYFTGNDGSFKQASEEFRLLVNGKVVSSADGWRLERIVPARDDCGGSGASVQLVAQDGAMAVHVEYLLYPDLALVRKRLSIINVGRARLRLESIEIERFNFEEYWPSTFSWVMSDYGRRKSLVPFQGTRQDALVALHNPDWQEGIVLGNEAPGVCKSITAFAEGRYFSAGLTARGQPYAFSRHLAGGARFDTPQVFSIVYAATARFETVLDTTVAQFVRRHMGIRLLHNPYRPSFVYNTWEPFQDKINEALLFELIDAAAAAGAKEFVIDDGWQDVNGDWGVDLAKFPRGLAPVFARIKERGMKPGLWVSVGSADRKSAVCRAHPEWFVENRAGKLENLHLESWAGSKLTACFSTGWRDYIARVLLRLIDSCGLEYLKLDFAIVTSPYVFDAARSGCYSRRHGGPHGHADQAESLLKNYEGMWAMFDQLHAAHPGLFIDCTFEAMGGLQMVDYAMLKHAEGNWLSNFNEPDQVGDLRIRQMAWWRAPAMPAASLVIGNARMEDSGIETHLQSLAGTFAMLLGDPRKLGDAQRSLCRRYGAWYEAMQARYRYMDYRQDLPGLGEPQEGSWDGFLRLNSEDGSGGIAGIFRHGAPGATWQLRLAYLQPRHHYRVLDLDGATVLEADGASLMAKGWEVRIDAPYAGRLFEVRKV